jgi:hypothetical protein
VLSLLRFGHNAQARWLPFVALTLVLLVTLVAGFVVPAAHMAPAVPLGVQHHLAIHGPYDWCAGSLIPC